MFTENYDYKIINVVKILLVNKSSVLLVQEPEDYDWMPLHWGLPGGKSTEKESLKETFERRCQQDIGQKLNPEGVLYIKELLMSGKTVVMYIIKAKTPNPEVKGDAASYKWCTKKDIEGIPFDQYTEFYNKKMLLNFFETNPKPAPFEIIESLNYYDLNNNENYKKWINSGKK